MSANLANNNNNNNNNNINNNNNNNNNGNEQQQFALLQIQDIDNWLRFNGLRSADDYEEGAECGSFLSVLNRSEAHAKHEAEEKYQQDIHASIFKEALEAEEQEKSIKAKLLRRWQSERMEIQSAERIVSVPLGALAEVSDTVFTMASSRRYMNTYGKDEEEAHHPVHLSLQDYSAEAVQEFLDLALGKKSMANVDDDHVVDCCQISHYLQCQKVLDWTNQVLLRNVDSDNCLSLCQMADQLDLPDLFEKSLFHMLASLDHMESQEAYDDFSAELKDRIAGIRAVFTKRQAHVHSSNGDNDFKKSIFYFTSLEEYIAIFAENVQYQRERLEEAKAQNSVDYSPYAQSKIDKQELRVLTLEAMLREQKRMFDINKPKHRYAHGSKRMRQEGEPELN